MSQIDPFREALGKVEQVASALGAILTPAQWEQLALFLSILSDYNAHTNLVSGSDPETLSRQHVLDSLTLVPPIQSQTPSGFDPAGSPKTLVDIGSGGGFPGLVLAIALPLLSVTLVDSVAKKTRFLETAVEALSLSDRVSVLTARAEELGHEENYRNQFELATARAVGRFDIVAELCLPLIKPGGQALIQKSARQLLEDEARARACLPKLQARLEAVERPNPALLGREAVIMRVLSLGPAPKTYPRKWAKIKAIPL